MITEITKEQKNKIPQFIKKWVDKASEPIDRAKTIRVVKELFGEDKTVLIAESLQNSIDIIKFIANGKKLEYDSQLGSQLVSQLDSQLGSQLRSQLRSQLGSQLLSQLDSQLLSQLDSQLGSQLRSQLGLQLGSQLLSQLDSRLDSTGLKYARYVSIWWYSWLGYYDYAKEIGVKFDENVLDKMEEIILNVPIIITLGQILIVIDKPKCKWNNNGFLHSDEFKAIRWKDNDGMYFLNGVKFGEELWKKVVSHQMSLKEVLQIDDIDQRTQAMKYVEVEDLLKQFNAETLSTFQKLSIGGEIVNYKLVKIPAHKDLFTIDSYHAVYNCPSTNKIYMSGIDPEIGKLGDIKQAMAWKSKMKLSDWEYLVPLSNES